MSDLPTPDAAPAESPGDSNRSRNRRLGFIALGLGAAGALGASAFLLLGHHGGGSSSTALPVVHHHHHAAPSPSASPSASPAPAAKVNFASLRDPFHDPFDKPSPSASPSAPAASSPAAAPAPAPAPTSSSSGNPTNVLPSPKTHTVKLVSINSTQSSITWTISVDGKNYTVSEGQLFAGAFTVVGADVNTGQPLIDYDNLVYRLQPGKTLTV